MDFYERPPSGDFGAAAVEIEASDVGVRVMASDIENLGRSLAPQNKVVEEAYMRTEREILDLRVQVGLLEERLDAIERFLQL